MQEHGHSRDDFLREAVFACVPELLVGDDCRSQGEDVVKWLLFKQD